MRDWWTTNIATPVVNRDKRPAWWQYPAFVAAAALLVFVVERSWNPSQDADVAQLPDPCAAAVDRAAIDRLLPGAIVDQSVQRPAENDVLAGRRGCQWIVPGTGSLSAQLSRYDTAEFAAQASVPSTVPPTLEQVAVTGLPEATFAAIVHRTPGDPGDSFFVVARQSDVVVVVSHNQAGVRPSQAVIDLVVSTAKAQLDQLTS
jgi:hypothetical protein